MANYKYRVDAERLRAERERLGLTVDALAALLGVRAERLRRAENGQETPRVDTLYRFALLAEVPNSVFFLDETDS